MTVTCGYLVPEFPGQTHAFFRREIDALARRGIRCEPVSTRRPAAAERCHGWAAEAAARTVYLFPPGAAGLAAAAGALLRAGPAGWARCAAAIATASGCGVAGRLRLAALAVIGGRLAGLARRRGWAHVHVHSAADSAAIASFCRMLGGPPFSVTLHGALRQYGPARRLKWGGAEFGITVTRALLAELLASDAGLDPGRLEVAPMGVDLEIFRRRAEAKPRRAGECMRVVSCGRLHRGKGHQDLVEAIAGLDATLTIIGTGPMQAELAALVAERGLGDRVRLAGALSEQDVRDELEQAHVFALASREEAIGVATMEAMAMELPVVVTGVGPAVAGVAELVRDGVEGLLVPPRDPGALAAALRRVASDPGLARRLGAAGRRRIEESFGSDRSAAVIARRLVPAAGAAGAAVAAPVQGVAP